MKTPVLLLIFNRPELTFTVFQEIRTAKPEKLFIAADGPREGKEGEPEKCEQTRSIVKQIDWNCEVKTLFRDKNLGCRNAVSSAITWFFNNVEEGIILEDDCLPDPSFFKFCQALLEKYRKCEQVMHIGGNNFQNGRKRGEDSYYFSNFAHIWGWATWRRAWKNYNVEMIGLEEFIQQKSLEKKLRNKFHSNFYLKKLADTKSNRIQTWDYQWSFTIWKNNGISIIPNANLVSNIGFGNNSTHTHETESDYSLLKTEGITNITHPISIVISREADDYFAVNQTGYRNSIHYYFMQIKRRLTTIAFQAYTIFRKQVP